MINEEEPTAERYKGKCIILLSKRDTYVAGRDKVTKDVNEARVFPHPSKAGHFLEAKTNNWKVWFEPVLLPVKTVQIGKPLLLGKNNKWFKG